MTYATTMLRENDIIATIKDSQMTINVVGHYIGYCHRMASVSAQKYEVNREEFLSLYPVCETVDHGESPEDENIISRAFYNSSLMHVSIYDNVAYVGDNSIPLPLLSQKLLVAINNGDIEVTYGELLPLWEQFLNENGIAIDESVYEIL